MPELLLEVGCEEIPADDLLVLPGVFKERAATAFEANRLVCDSLDVYATPRRLTLVAELPAMQKELREERLGPPKRAAFGADGKLSAAGLGFAKNLGIAPENLKIVQTAKGEYVAAEIVEKGKPAEDILKGLIPALILGLPFRKFMKWGLEEVVFGRPIRRLVFLFGGDVLPMTIAGVSSGRATFGHRFLGSNRIEVSSFAEYRKKLFENGVYLSFEERSRKIADELHALAKESGGKLREDDDLLRIMADEVEYPEVLMGSFPAEFLKLPQEILMNAMRKHQKYFCAVNEEGHLLPVFFTVLNTRADKGDLIRRGHERVLQARLRDAEFFWKEDCKTPLEARSVGLSRLTYHEKLGAYNEKIQRMGAIAHDLLAQAGRSDLESSLQNLVHICKTDLLTLMVGEFAELQGIMAGLYARQEGYQEQEWQALYDQYLPVTGDDSVPRNIHGAILSLADRVEVLSSGFVLNMAPTGSKDPYALRRVATGAARILLEHQLGIDLRPAFDRALSLYNRKTKLSRSEMLKGLMDLMEARFRFLMEQKGIGHDTLNAILAVDTHSLPDASARVLALWAKRESDDIKTLARCFKRIHNIIAGQSDLPFDSEALVDDGEKRLHQVFSDLEFRVRQLIDDHRYLDALDIMVTLGPEIDNFFDEVMVMAEDKRLRENRIALLQAISRLYRRIADFSQLQIEL